MERSSTELKELDLKVNAAIKRVESFFDGLTPDSFAERRNGHFPEFNPNQDLVEATIRVGEIRGKIMDVTLPKLTAFKDALPDRIQRIEELETKSKRLRDLKDRGFISEAELNEALSLLQTSEETKPETPKETREDQELDTRLEEQPLDHEEPKEKTQVEFIGGKFVKIDGDLVELTKEEFTIFEMLGKGNGSMVLSVDMSERLSRGSYTRRVSVSNFMRSLKRKVDPDEDLIVHSGDSGRNSAYVLKNASVIWPDNPHPSRNHRLPIHEQRSQFQLDRLQGLREDFAYEFTIKFLSHLRMHKNTILPRIAIQILSQFAKEHNVTVSDIFDASPGHYSSFIYTQVSRVLKKVEKNPDPESAKEKQILNLLEILKEYGHSAETVISDLAKHFGLKEPNLRKPSPSR